MPTVSSMDLPKPKNWQDFERIVRDALAQMWKSTTLQMNGRPGQKQNGLDIHGPDDIGRASGVQCKRYKPPLKLKVVTDEISNAETFKGRLTTLFVATTADHDARLQEQVRLLSDKRVAQGKFAVSLLFWDDIVNGLVLNPAVFQAHYPQVVLQVPKAIDNERLIAALELGYYGADLWEYASLVYGEFGWMAQADPDEFVATLRLVERRAQQLLAPDDAAPIVEALGELRQGCLREKSKQSDWDPVEVHAKRASMRVEKASSLLKLAESNVLDLAIQLGRIYHHMDDAPTAALQASITVKVNGVLPAASGPAIRRTFLNAKRSRSGYKWAMRIYALLDREIRYRM